MIPIEQLQKQFNHHVALRERRPGIWQLVAPLYHEDGDMVDIFLEVLDDGRIRVSDHAMTVMRLSYALDLNTSSREKVFQRILAENQVSETNGRLFLDVAPESLYPGILQFAQTVYKVTSMRLYRREVIANMFYDLLGEFVEQNLRVYTPFPKSLPIPEREELEVDFTFPFKPRPVYLFGVKDDDRARLVTISCLEFHRNRLPFRSFAVHEDFEALSRKDRLRITSAVDKQFISLDDFTSQAAEVFERETA